MTTAVDVSWQLDGITMGGTLVRPDGEGPFPAVVLVAGSGPTDRDWCSPLLPGTNGSARLFAEAFAEAGIASLRYDKRVSGSPEEVAAAPGNGYNADGARLDPEALEVILGWLRAVLTT